MKHFRIIKTETYNGCLPVTIYMVQVSHQGLFSTKWTNVKGFDRRERAVELYNLLTK